MVSTNDFRSLLICRMNSKPLKTVSTPLALYSSLRHSGSKPCILSPIINIWLLHPPKTVFFFKQSQNGKIVLYETFTICIIKSNLIKNRTIFLFYKFPKFLHL